MKVFCRIFLLCIIFALAAHAKAGINNPGSGSGIASPTGRVLQGGFDNGTHSFAFANMMKLATSETSQFCSSNIPDYPKFLDANGYPNLNGGVINVGDCIQGVVFLPSGYGTGVWDLQWSGTGGFELAATGGFSNLVVIAGSCGSSNLPFFLYCTGTNGHVTFTFTNGTPSGAVTWEFPAATYSGMSNLILCRHADLAAVTANPNAFNPDFISLVTALNPRTIRALDWAAVNGGNQSHFSQRTPTSGFAYRNPGWVPSLWAGTTTNSGDNYSVAVPSTWPGLVNGAAVQVMFNLANTTISPMLNVGSTGAVAIVDRTTNAPSIGGIGLKSLATLTYDSVLNKWIWTSDGFLAQVPLEEHMALANAINANLWFNIPHLYDATVDGAAIVTVVKVGLKPGLNFYPELSNEVWNPGGAFAQTSYALGEGTALGFTTNEQVNSWYALRSRQMMGAITTAWGGPASNLKRVMAFSASAVFGSTATNNTYRFQGSDLSSFGYSSFPNRPIDFADAMSYATYYSGAQLVNADANYANPMSIGGPNSVGIYTGLLGAADDYASGVPAQMTNALAFVDWDIRAGIRISSAVSSISSSGAAVITAAASHNLSVGQQIALNTTGSFDPNITAGKNYFVIAAGLTAAQFEFSNTLGGAAVTVSGASTGTITYGKSGTGETLQSLSTYASIGASGGILGFYPSWEQIAAGYDGVGTNRPTGTQNLTVENYEGGYEGVAPSASVCTSLSIAAKYCGAGGEIDVLNTAYKNNSLFNQLVQDQYSQFCGGTLCGAGGSTLPHSKTPAWYNFQGPTQWSLQPGDAYSTPFQSYTGSAAYNHQ